MPGLKKVIISIKVKINETPSVMNRSSRWKKKFINWNHFLSKELCFIEIYGVIFQGTVLKYSLEEPTLSIFQEKNAVLQKDCFWKKCRIQNSRDLLAFFAIFFDYNIWFYWLNLPIKAKIYREAANFSKIYLFQYVKMKIGWTKSYQRPGFLEKFNVWIPLIFIHTR